MASIFKSSIGKKLIMSVTGICLILFLTFHMVMNLTYVFDPDTVVYGTICKILSMGWVNVIVPLLAAFFVIHILYAFILTITNRQARGQQRSEISNKAKTDSWSARNMFVLGIIILGALGLHLMDFWAHMQLQEFMGNEAENPYTLLTTTFGPWWLTTLYLLWFVAIWFHLCHGFWSMFQTIGWSGQTWMKRLKVIGVIFATLIFLLFAATAVNAFVQANFLAA